MGDLWGWLSWVHVWFPMQDYKSLRVAIMIWVIVVNANTHRRILNMISLVLAELKGKGWCRSGGREEGK